MLGLSQHGLRVTVRCGVPLGKFDVLLTALSLIRRTHLLGASGRRDGLTRVMGRHDVVRAVHVHEGVRVYAPAIVGRQRIARQLTLVRITFELQVEAVDGAVHFSVWDQSVIFDDVQVRSPAERDADATFFVRRASKTQNVLYSLFAHCMRAR